jgi:hypothetical protein
MQLSNHEITLAGRVTSGPKDTIGRRSELRLTPDSIRSTILGWVAQHPDEFGAAIRAIVQTWDDIDTANTVRALDGRRVEPIDNHGGYSPHYQRLYNAATTKGE